MKHRLRKEANWVVIVTIIGILSLMVSATLAFPTQPRDPNTYHITHPTPTPTPTQTNGSDSNSAEAPAISAPNLGLVTIYTSQAQPVYSSPGGEVIHVDGVALWLPNDADGSGSDSYVVLDMVFLNDEVWVALFLGGANPGWVGLDDVTPMTYLGEDALLGDG